MFRSIEGYTSGIDPEPVPVSHRSNSLDFVFRKSEPEWGRGEEHRVFTQEVGAEREDVVGLWIRRSAHPRKPYRHWRHTQITIGWFFFK